MRKNSRKNKTVLNIDATRNTGETIMSPKNVIAAARRDLQNVEENENLISDNNSSQDFSAFEHQHHQRPQ